MPDNRAPAADSVYHPLRIGAAFDFSRIAQQTSFDVYTTGSLCGQYSAGSRQLAGFEIFAESSPFDNHFWLTSHLTFSTAHVEVLSGILKTAEGRRSDGSTVDILKQYRFATNLFSTRLSIGSVYEVASLFRGGLALSVTFQHAGQQTADQLLIAPLGAVFGENNSDELPLINATAVAFRPIVPGLDAVVGADLPLGRRLTLHPELRAWLPFIPIASNVAWREFGIGASLGISFDLAHRPDTAVTMPVVDMPRRTPPVAHKPVLRATITARGVGTDKREYADPVIEIEEAPWVEWVPVIPYVFFDSCVTAIPARYLRLADSSARAHFHVDSLAAVTPLDIHWQMLNIVGDRMRSNAGEHVTLVGTTSGDELTNPSLGLARAKSVADYLEGVWGIDSARISITSELRTASASPEETREGREENRRVELRLSDEDLARPIEIRRLAKVATPPEVHFYPEVTADTTTTDWFVSVEQGGRELLRFLGSGEDTTIKVKPWSIGDMRVNRDMTPIRYRFVIHDVTGATATAEGTFRIVERQHADDARPRPSLTEFSLVGFGYNLSELQPQHYAQLEEAAKTISTNAEVSITGFTDHVGNAQNNRQLSLDRGRAVLAALRSNRERLGLGLLPQINVLGLGDEQVVFDNSLPEGRLLSRMVRITISKPSNQ